MSFITSLLHLGLPADPALRIGLAQQPQPAYRGAGERVYGMALYDLDIRWIVHPHGCEVIAIEPGPAAGE